jgi:hypothetical protein
MAQGGFVELGPILELPGTPRSLLSTLRKLWDADLELQTLAAQTPRLADLALLEHRVHGALPGGVQTPRILVKRALTRVQFAPAALGPVVIEGHVHVPPVWRPLLAALADTTDLIWCGPKREKAPWFLGQITKTTQSKAATPELVCCATPHSETVEALRWLRKLLTSGQARPEEVAICATAPQPWDEHFLALARNSELPLHFSHGIPALATRDGQACAALADVLLSGISQERVRRLLSYGYGRELLLNELPSHWGAGIRAEAGLFEAGHWRRALRAAAASRPAGELDPAPLLLPIIDLLARGVAVADEAGAFLLSPSSRTIWAEALHRAPPHALEYSLQELRVPDSRDPGVSAVWCPVEHLAGAPRRWVRLIGMTSRAWPRPMHEDPLLPNHILASRLLDPDPVTERDRRLFHIILRSANSGCTLSYSRRDAQGKPLTPSPLVRPYGPTATLRRTRMPAHAFSTSDRLMARPQEAATCSIVAAASHCWTNRQREAVTAHDGGIRASHPLIKRSLDQLQSATSLRRLLRDPLGFVWRYALGWRTTEQEEQPLNLDPRRFGELVHELLKRAVDLLEPSPGVGRANEQQIEDALAAAAGAIHLQWPLERAIPPLLLWQHTVEAATALTRKALSFDEPFQSDTRSWTEVKFGETAASLDLSLPWDCRLPVQLPGTNIQLRGSIDRIDVRTSRAAVRVSDYKTGPEPKNADRIVFQGGAELQRVIYAAAVRQLLPDVSHIYARLVFLGNDPKPRAHLLSDPDRAIAEISSHIAAGRALLERGVALPGPDAQEPWNEMRLALPAALGSYLELKRQPFARALASIERIWKTP